MVASRLLPAAIVVAVAMLPWVCGGERKTLDDDARRGLPGNFAKLNNGRTCYELRGDAPAEAIVFVHGLASPSSVWAELPKTLRESGFLTLTYDLYGRGWSDRPRVGYDLDLFDEQLGALMRMVGLQRSVHLVGLSMGGIIATEFALRHPGQVASLTLIDPAGFPVDPPAGARLLTAPLLGDWLVQVFGDRFLVAAMANNVHDKRRVDDLVRGFLPQLEFAGYKRALLSSLRHMPLSDFEERYAQVGRTGLPIEVFWGKQDEVTPLAGATLAAHLLPKAAVHLVEDAGHLSHYEKTDEVAATMLAFLRTVEAPLQDRLRGPGDDENIEAGAAVDEREEYDFDPAARRHKGAYSRPRVGQPDNAAQGGQAK